MATWPFAKRHAPAVIGMLHALPLPGSPWRDADLEAARSRVEADAAALARGGVDGLLLENFGDAPFFPRRVPPETVAQMTTLARAAQNTASLPLGINVLRNDGLAALAVAHAVGADFIRVNLLCGQAHAPEGLLTGEAHELLRRRAALGAENLAIFADAHVKHATPAGARPLEEETADLVGRGGADAVIVSGTRTGAAVDGEKLAAARAAADGHPLLVGSGVDGQSLPFLAAHADAVIAGTSLKREGDVHAPVEAQRVRAMVAARDGG